MRIKDISLEAVSVILVVETTLEYDGWVGGGRKVKRFEGKKHFYMSSMIFICAKVSLCLSYCTLSIHP